MNDLDDLVDTNLQNNEGIGNLNDLEEDLDDFSLEDDEDDLGLEGEIEEELDDAELDSSEVEDELEDEDQQ